MTFDLNPTQTLAMALGVLYLGSFVIARVAFLRDNNIPVPVVGGILFALVTTLLYVRWDVGASFDMALKGPLSKEYYRAGFISADTVRLGIAVPLHLAAERFYSERSGRMGGSRTEVP